MTGSQARSISLAPPDPAMPCREKRPSVATCCELGIAYDGEFTRINR